jgi:hypothetical protein
MNKKYELMFRDLWGIPWYTPIWGKPMSPDMGQYSGLKHLSAVATYQT